jgi:beta-glucosidase
VQTQHRVGRLAVAAAATALVAGIATGVGFASAARTPPVTLATCAAKPWVSASYQAASTPAALGALVLSCLKLEDPATYRHDEVGLVALNAYPWFENVNEFGLTSTVQQQLAQLDMPPITLEDGPGGLITHGARPAPTQLPNELALAATFDLALATTYGDVLGLEASQMGYDGVQAPDLNLLRVPSWGRAMESFGESPVLAGELGAAEAVAIMSHHEIPVLKHFGPYSQEIVRHELDQLVSVKALREVYLRPFTFALEALKPQLLAGGHAVGIMCSYGNVNKTKACRSPAVANELRYAGVTALVRSDLQVRVPPSQLLLNGVDLIKPMDSKELTLLLSNERVDVAIDKAVARIFATEFADGLVNGTTTAAVARPLPRATAHLGTQDAVAIEERAIVLLKDAGGVLPLAAHAPGRIAVVADGVTSTCQQLAATLAHDTVTPTSCVDKNPRLVATPLFGRLPTTTTRGGTTRYATFTPHYGGAYVVQVTTPGNTDLWMDGRAVIQANGNAEINVRHTATVSLRAGVRYQFRIGWVGLGPSVLLVRTQPLVSADQRAVRGARLAVVVAYDQAREGMDRTSLQLPGAQDQLISAVASTVPTVVLLATTGATAMPWLGQVQGALEVWNPTGALETDYKLRGFVPAYAAVLDGAVDPSGRLPETYPVTAARSPMGVRTFWPGWFQTVNLDAAPYQGVGIGAAWYRAARWPVLFPFGYGLSYTTFRLVGGSVNDVGGALTAQVSVRDTGARAGTEVVQLYADWPAAAKEPPLQLVGFGAVTFSAADAAAGTVRQVAIPISPTALSVFDGTTMAIQPGRYCFEAATYDGDPHGLATGALSLGATTGGTITGPSSTALQPADCPA